MFKFTQRARLWWSPGDLTSYDLNTILDERGRELYWEGFRRTDLIRFGKFSGNNYLWPWKGGVKAGAGKDSHFNLFPIPASEIISNTNLQQNEGY
ncbi:RagB/SusD family nutrient uptake outer membrane protein [Arachidicoccus ginsenosidivorans]|uniref:RagB/SusD family nutrient uptake outer membrane protein n=1 Tax=Arachidicoccus ginsenosidivorans TaxID=496057 RepID=UPI0021CE57FB|nr:RagB/SusD family nutrient uptake outer membrane protein [Arachidicoccus ginsenosidivorans]